MFLTGRISFFKLSFDAVVFFSWGGLNCYQNFTGHTLVNTIPFNLSLITYLYLMQVHLSQHSFPLTSVMQKSLIEGYFDFLEDLLNICEVSEELADLPINIVDEPQFDSDNLPAIQEFLAPGVFVLIVFFLANVLSGEFFIEERLVSTL